jgi:hypothetical protein
VEDVIESVRLEDFVESVAESEVGNNSESDFTRPMRKCLEILLDFCGITSCSSDCVSRLRFSVCVL